jgi:hypothetical protein
LREHLTDVLAAAGVVVIAAGLALVYVPAGVIAVGVALVVTAVMRAMHEPTR